MSKGIWRYLEKLPPIDWAYLASQRVQRGRGYRFTRKQIEAIQKTRRANAAAKAKAAAKRVARRLTRERQTGRARNLNAMILGAMEPGQWYGRPDIRDRSGAKRNSVHARLAKLEREGYVRRAENEDHVPVEYRKGLGIDWQARGRSPQWLFSLTAKGEAERERLAYLL